MRILITSREALFPNIGGHREYLLETIKGLAAHGNYIDVLSWGTEQNYEYKTTNIMEYHYQSADDKLATHNNLSFLNKSASFIGIGQLHTIRHRGLGIDHASDLLKNNYDIALQNGPDSNGIAYYIGNKLNIPKVERLDWVGLPYRSNYYKQWLNYINEPYYPYMYFYKYFDKYVTKFEAKSTENMDCVYTHTKADMVKIGQFLGQSRLNYINPFLYEENKESIDNEQPLMEGKYILFYSTPSINSYEAIKYIYKMAKLNEEIKYVITGNFNNLRIDFARENLIFLDEMPLDEFYNVLKNAYIVIFPLTLGHGIQMKLIRAFSFSKAVLANDGVLKPIEDLVQDNKNIVIGETPSKFYEKLLSLYEDESLINKIGHNSYNLYKKYFSSEISINKLNEYLKICRNEYGKTMQ